MRTTVLRDYCVPVFLYQQHKIRYYIFQFLLFGGRGYVIGGQGCPLRRGGGGLRPANGGFKGEVTPCHQSVGTTTIGTNLSST